MVICVNTEDVFEGHVRVAGKGTGPLGDGGERGSNFSLLAFSLVNVVLCACIIY